MTAALAFPKPVRKRDPSYIRWIRKQGCLICRRYAQAHHVHAGGVGTKGSDYDTIPFMPTSPPGTASTWTRCLLPKMDHRRTGRDCGLAVQVSLGRIPANSIPESGVSEATKEEDGVSMKTATAPIISQFRSEFEKLFDWNYRSCDHEREIADDIENDVRKLLEKFGLLDYEPELAALDKCRFCGSTEWALVHQAWCIESPTLSVLTNRSPVGGKP